MFLVYMYVHVILAHSYSSKGRSSHVNKPIFYMYDLCDGHCTYCNVIRSSNLCWVGFIPCQIYVLHTPIVCVCGLYLLWSCYGVKIRWFK